MSKDPGKCGSALGVTTTGHIYPGGSLWEGESEDGHQLLTHTLVLQEAQRLCVRKPLRQ